MNQSFIFRKASVVLGFLALLTFLLAACAPAAPAPQTGSEGTPTAAPAVTEPPAGVFAGLKPEDILLQLTYEPGFTLPEYRFAFGRTPYFTLLADGSVMYIDESQDFKVMEARLSQDEAAALLQQVREMGFARLESHTDMCGKLADGSEPCIADASTTVMRVRMEDGSLREIRNYANFSNGPTTYDAIYNLMNEYTHSAAAVYVPHAAALFIRMVPQPEMASPAEWPLDAAYIQRAQNAPEQFTAVALSAEEAALWQKNVGVVAAPIVFQHEGQSVSAMFVPWLPGEDFTAEMQAEFPAK
jgi:hypothetical protein